MTTRHVTDVVRDLHGAVLPNATVTFALTKSSYTGSAAYMRTPVTVTTDSQGAYDAVLWCDEEGAIATRYQATYPADTFKFDLPVGDLSPVLMSSLRAAAPGVPVANLQTLVDALTAADVGADPSGTAAGLVATEATARAGGDTTNATAITTEASARSAADSTHAALTTTAHGGIVKPPLAMSFSQNGDIYFVAHEAMTLTTPVEAGTGTLAYTRALAASPTSFSTLTFPGTLATGDILKVTLTGITTYKALTAPRSA